MSTNLGKNDAPAAGRIGTPGWKDPRLWIGVALVAASVLIGARVLGGADDAMEVWAAGADLGQGQELTAEDLVVRRVDFADDEDRNRYLSADEDLPDTATLTRSIGAGELVPVAALGTRDGSILEVPLFLPAVSVPPDLGPGAVIDVYVTPAPGSGEKAGRDKAVLDDVVVIAAPKPDDTFGPAADRQIVVAVKEESEGGIPVVLAAAKDGRLSIIGDAAK